MTACPRIADFEAYLQESRHPDVEAHLPACNRCRAIFERLAATARRVDSWLSSLASPQDDAPVDMGLLGRLASATGGRVIDPAAADGWLPTAPETPTTVVKRQSFDLWHNFALVLVLCVLMAGDWSLRLFRGYV